MSFLFPIMYFILANGLLVLISKKSFGKCLPVMMMINAFVYFFSQVIFHTFKVGFVVNVLFAIIFIIALIYMKIKGKNFDTLKENFFSTGFYAFLIAYVIISIFDLNRTFTAWDDFSHWGMMVKEMFRIDKLYSVPTSTLMVHKDYPPIMQLLELFFSHLIGKYDESSLIRFVRLSCFVLFLPALDHIGKFDKKNIIIKTIIIMGIAFLTFMLFDEGVIHSIYNDYVMTIVVSYLIIHIILSKNPLENFSLVVLSLGLSFLVLTKQIALTLYFMVLFMFFIDVFLKYRQDKIRLSKKSTIYMVLKVLILLVIIPLLLWKGWSRYVEKLNLTQQFNISNVNLADLPGIIYGSKGEKYQIDTASNYLYAIKTKKITTSDTLNLSYVQCFALVILLLYLIWIYGKKYFYKKELFFLAVTLSIGFIGYAFVMLVSYVFLFDSNEGPILACFIRYVGAYVLICLSVVIMLFVFIENKKGDSIKKLFIIFLCLFIIQSPSRIGACFPKLTKSIENDSLYHAEIINKKTKKNSKVFLLTQSSNGSYQFYVKYYANPRIVNSVYATFPVNGVNYKEYFDKNINDYLLNFDYLYLLKADKELISKYRFIFPDDDIKDTNLYKVKNNNGKVELIKVT